MSSFLLFPSLLNRSACRVNCFLFRSGIRKSEKVPIPVISVGNISFGGSEKTPLVVHLLSFLFNQGFRPAMISRGYRGSWEAGGGILSDGRRLYGGWEEAGEEAYMVCRRLPQAGIFIGKDRLKSCFRAMDMGFDIVVLDDGFQHLRLERDLDVVLFDPGERTALRESRRGLSRADAILVKDTAPSGSGVIPETRAEVFRYSVRAAGLESWPVRNPAAVDSLPQARVLAVAGIAKPERFLSTMAELGIRPVRFLRFPDHHTYPPSSVRRIIREFRSSRAEAFLTTEKDIYKVGARSGLSQLALHFLRIDVHPTAAFIEFLRASLAEIRSSRA